VYTHKQLLRTLLTVVCLVALPVSSQAAGTVQVAVDKLNVRSGPSLNDAVLTTLPAKTVLPVVGEKENWVQVQLPDGRKGWLANWLVKQTASAPQAESQIDGLNVRSGPSLTFPVIQTINPRTKYPILQKSGQWVQIQLSSQQKGWVAGWLIKEHGSLQSAPTPPAEAQNIPAENGSQKGTEKEVNTLTLDFSPYVYPEPNDQVPAIGQLQAGETIEKVSQNNGWIQISYQGMQAWIRLPKPDNPPVQSPAPPTGVSAPPVSSEETATVESASVNLRSEANTTSTILASLSQGTPLTILQSKGDWYQVKTADGLTGWVAGWLIDVKKPSADVPAKAMLTILNPDTNIRSGPGTTYDIVTRVQDGERFPIVKQEDDWYQIRLTDGTTGYVAGWLVAADGAAPVVKGNELVGRVIVVDAGHGGNDTGATGSSFSTLEKTINLQVALMLRNKLEAAGAKVIMTRSDDRKLTLQQRVDVAVQNKADVFVSIHHNTHPNTLTNGTIVFYYNKGNSSKLASLVQNEIVKATNYKDLQSRFGNYFVLRENPVVSILTEIGFLSNYNEEIRLRSAKQQDLAAEGIYRGLLQYFASVPPKKQ
jgi:N-acetylmuramoyl-L-alanine amidase